MNYYLDVLKKYAVFSGRASRKEFWMYILFNVIIGIVLAAVGPFIGDKNMVIYTIYMLAVIVPTIAVEVRRLHDIGKSGWWWFIALVPAIGGIWLIVLLATGSQQADNKYGSKVI